jgi:hypothetical protein
MTGGISLDLPPSWIAGAESLDLVEVGQGLGFVRVSVVEDSYEIAADHEQGRQQLAGALRACSP